MTGKAKKVIVKIWIVSFLVASPWSLFTRVNYLIFNNELLEESAWCSVPFDEENLGSVYLILSYSFLFFILPLIIVSVLYIRLPSPSPGV